MVHKIWDKDTGDSEVGSTRDHLIKSYQSVYMDPAPSCANREKAIAENLIGLTMEMSLAELTSLEQLLFVMVNRDEFDMSVVDVLWNMFAMKKKDISDGSRRGALIILSMLGKAKKEIISNNFDVLLKIGLGELGKVFSIMCVNFLVC